MSKYEITSDVQRQEVSDVLACHNNVETVQVDENDSEELEDKVVIPEKIPVVSTVTVNGTDSCSCQKTYDGISSNIRSLIDGILQAKRKSGKAVIKI